MPGHAAMQAWPEYLRGGLAQYDTTELPSSDDLLHPRPDGPVLQAEELAADYWGAGKTLLLTGGSTQGIHTMLSLVCERGQALWVDRYQHKSVFHACQLLDLRPAYTQIRQILLRALYAGDVEEDGTLTPGSGAAEALADELERMENLAPDAPALIIQSPDYDGRQLPLRSLAGALHAKGRLLLVDEAHGAIRAGSLYDKRALQQGADLVAQSGHKTTAALTPGAWLHLGKDYLRQAPYAPEQARAILDLTGTSSPSLLIAASLDYARWVLAAAEVQVVEKEGAIQSFRELLAQETGYYVPDLPDNVKAWCDPLRLRIYGKQPIQGSALQARLLEHGIDVEASGPDYILLLVSLYQDAKDLEVLAGVLREDLPGKTNESYAEKSGLPLELTDALPLPEKVLEPAEALLAQRRERLQGLKEIPWEEAVGEVAMAEVMPYPPGVPVILAGERVTEELVQLLGELVDSGVHLDGLQSDGTLAVWSHVSKGTFRV